MYEKKILLGFIRVHILHHANIDGGVYGVEMINELKNHANGQTKKSSNFFK